MNNIGRPEYPHNQYQTWLDELTPFLKAGYSLYYAMDKALLLRHKDSIYRKYRENDWFCEKVDAFRRYPGEVVNSIFYRLIKTIDDKMSQGYPINDEEWRNLRFFAEKHKSCQPFFATRFETKNINENEVQKTLDALEQRSDYSSLGEKIEEEQVKLLNAEY